MLPEPWRLGRTQNGKRLLSYGDTWVEHITVDDSFQQSVKNAVENPGARAYVPMFKNGALNMTPAAWFFVLNYRTTLLLLKTCCHYQPCSMQVKRAQNGGAVLAKPTAAMLLLARYNRTRVRLYLAY